jgi:hypothetical protein
MMLALLVWVACSEDEPQPLDPGGAFVPRDPMQAFEAIRDGLASETSDQYIRYFSDDFVFSPTPDDSLRSEFVGTGTFDNWTRSVESSVLVPLFNDARLITTQFAPSVVVNQNTRVRFQTPYQLEITDESGTTQQYRGVADIDLKNELGTWRITRWDEIENAVGYESWGYLRGILRQHIPVPVTEPR